MKTFNQHLTEARHKAPAETYAEHKEASDIVADHAVGSSFVHSTRSSHVSHETTVAASKRHSLHKALTGAGYKQHAGNSADHYVKGNTRVYVSKELTGKHSWSKRQATHHAVDVRTFYGEGKKHHEEAK